MIGENRRHRTKNIWKKENVNHVFVFWFKVIVMGLRISAHSCKGRNFMHFLMSFLISFQLNLSCDNDKNRTKGLRNNAWRMLNFLNLTMRMLTNDNFLSTVLQIRLWEYVPFEQDWTAYPSSALPSLLCLLLCGLESVCMYYSWDTSEWHGNYIITDYTSVIYNLILTSFAKNFFECNTVSFICSCLPRK